MEVKIYSEIPDFESRMKKLVKVVGKLMVSDELYNRRITQAQNHQHLNNGNSMELWITSLRQFCRLGHGLEDSIFK